MGHVTEHCAKPKITRRWKRVGAVYACECGQLYRVVLASGYESSFWSWELVKASA
jgi:hypothetical protein